MRPLFGYQFAWDVHTHEPFDFTCGLLHAEEVTRAVLSTAGDVTTTVASHVNHAENQIALLTHLVLNSWE